MVFVIIGWVIFKSVDLQSAYVYVKGMFGFGAKGITDKSVWAYISQYWIFYVFALIGCAPVGPWIDKKLNKNKVWNVVYAAIVMVVLVVSASYIINNAYNPFIYFNF